MNASDDRGQDLSALRQRYDELYRKKIQADANLKTSTDNLEGVKQRARDAFGTDDLEALKAKLVEMKAENDRKLADYHEHLTTIEQELQKVEAEHTQAANREAKS